MLTPNLERLAKSGLTVTVDVAPNEIRVHLSGTCDREAVPHLPAFFEALHVETQSVGARQVVVDCENLYFMSSAAIKCFVMWIVKLKGVPPDRRYVVEFRINKRLQWQERSLSAICRFAPLFSHLV